MPPDGFIFGFPLQLRIVDQFEVANRSDRRNMDIFARFRYIKIVRAVQVKQVYLFRFAGSKLNLVIVSIRVVLDLLGDFPATAYTQSDKQSQQLQRNAE